MIKPIAMKCSLEQYKEIEPILLENGFNICTCSDFEKFPYLVNNASNKFKIVNNYDSTTKIAYGRTPFEEWNKDIFLEHCDIESFKLPKKWWVRRTSNNSKVINDYFNSLNPKYKYCYNPSCGIWDAIHSEIICKDVISPHAGPNTKESSVKEGFTEITFEQFEKYVLKQKSMRKLTVAITDVLEIHKIACVSWKPKIGKYLTRVNDEQNITFSEIEIDEMFGAATKEQKPVLVRIFGEKEEYKIGDWIKVENGGNGSEGARNFVGTIIDKREALNLDYHGEYNGSISPIYVKNNKIAWGLCSGYKIRKATPEEIAEATKPVIEWDKLKTGSKVKIVDSGEECNGITDIDVNKPVTIIFFKTPHYINSNRKFNKTGNYHSYCTFIQDGKFVLFAADETTDYITEVIEY